MNQDVVVSLTMDAISVAMKVALPMLMAGLVVGLVVSVFQAVTQIQEVTLTFVPKLVAVAVVIMVAGNWMLHEMVGFTGDLYEMIPRMADAV